MQPLMIVVRQVASKDAAELSNVRKRSAVCHGVTHLVQFGPDRANELIALTGTAKPFNEIGTQKAEQPTEEKVENLFHWSLAWLTSLMSRAATQVRGSIWLLGGNSRRRRATPTAEQVNRRTTSLRAIVSP